MLPHILHLTEVYFESLTYVLCSGMAVIMPTANQVQHAECVPSASSLLQTICLHNAVRVILLLYRTRSSADADNGLDAFSGQSRSTNMVPFWVHCDFSLSM